MISRVKEIDPKLALALLGLGIAHRPIIAAARALFSKIYRRLDTSPQGVHIGILITPFQLFVGVGKPIMTRDGRIDDFMMLCEFSVATLADPSATIKLIASRLKPYVNRLFVGVSCFLWSEDPKGQGH